MVSKKINLGEVMFFNGQYGFIKCGNEDVFFHKTDIIGEEPIEKGDEVEFKVKPSKRKPGTFQARKVRVVKKAEEKRKEVNDRKYKLGLVDWYDDDKGYGVIVADGEDYFIHESNLLFTSYLSENDYVIFSTSNYVRAGRAALKCQPFLSGLTKCSAKRQMEFLLKYEIKLYSSYQSNYKQIKAIGQSDEIEKVSKKTFLDSAYKKSNTSFKCKMLIDGLVELTEAEQSELLAEVIDEESLLLDYDQIKVIGVSEKISKTPMTTFLNEVFEKSNIEFKCNMFLDGLVELTEIEQSELFLSYKVEFYSYYSSKYNQIIAIGKSNRVDELIKESFLKSVFEQISSEYQYKILFEDSLIDIRKETVEDQIELLQRIGRLNTERINTVIESDKINELAKEPFLKSAFEKADAKCKYRILFEDCLIDVEKELPEAQIELLQKYVKGLERIYYMNYDKIKKIAQSKKIDEVVKGKFLKIAFEKADSEYQYKILFEDCLIDVEKELPEAQIELLQKYAKGLERIYYMNYDEIKKIAQSKKIDKVVKGKFLKTAFDQADSEYQYKILFEDYLIEIERETPQEQIELLQNFVETLKNIDFKDYDKIKTIAQSKKVAVEAKEVSLKTAFDQADSEYQYKILFEDCLIDIQKETIKDQIFFLQKIGELKIDQIRRITQSDKVEAAAKDAFLKSAYKKASSECRLSILFDDPLINLKEENTKGQIELLQYVSNYFEEDVVKESVRDIINKENFEFIEYIKLHKWLRLIKKIDTNLYNTLFNQNYPQILKIDRLLLWLENLNPYYNYLEFVQVAWQLSNDERKLLNKRIREHAKDERFQNFLKQIPKAVVIEEVETAKTYKCKWRNLYYHDGFIQVFFNKTSSSENYEWEPARKEWNLLTQEYFSRRKIGDIIVKVSQENEIIDITGLEDIEVRIIVAEIQKNGEFEKRTNISSNQVSRIIHNVSARNQCIDFLGSQKSDYDVTDIQELVSDSYGLSRRDISFLFPIQDKKGSVFFIWESAEFEKSKATHIFKCSEGEVETVQNKIKEFLESTIRSRSLLNSVESGSQKVKKGMRYLCRVNHDNFEYQVWEDRMRDVLPFLE